MSSRPVCITLDEESYMLWKRIPEKSRWVRVKLHEEIFDDDLVKHRMGERARREGNWDGKCNPNNYDKGICPTCWPPEALTALYVDPTNKMYLPPTPTPPGEGIKKFHARKAVLAEDE